MSVSILSRAAVGVGALAVTLVALAACSSGGTAVPVSSDSLSASQSADSTTSSQHGSNKSLDIQHPVDASPYLKHACHLLSDEQVDNLGGKPGSGALSTEQAGIGIPSSCSWDAKSGPASFDASFTTKYKTGLSRIRQGEKSDKSYDTIKDAKVVGYPALILKDDRDDKIGTCFMDVGVNDHTVLTLQVGGSTVSDPCEGLKNVAKAAIETMRKGS